MSRRNPDPWGDYHRDRQDISTAAAFFMTFALLALVAWVIFFGTGAILPAAVDALPLKQATRTPAAYATVPAAAAGITFPLTSTTSSAAPNQGSAATATSAPPTVTPKPAATTKLRIANTNGDGVYLRRTANDADHWIPWPETTVLTYMGEDQSNDGRTYKKVQDPRGNVGWMPSEFLVPADS